MFFYEVRDKTDKHALCPIPRGLGLVFLGIKATNIAILGVLIGQLGFQQVTKTQRMDCI